MEEINIKPTKYGVPCGSFTCNQIEKCGDCLHSPSWKPEVKQEASK